jgi:hypothetical protein
MPMRYKASFQFQSHDDPAAARRILKKLHNRFGGCLVNPVEMRVTERRRT